MESKNRTDKILDSLSDLKRAEPSPFLFRKIMNRMQEDIYLSPMTVFNRCMALTLFLAANVFGLYYYADNTDSNAKNEHSLYEDVTFLDSNVYFTYSEKNE